ncbi:MAG: ABC transporter ATP-binding protein, partial [Ensifer adhaerens]
MTDEPFVRISGVVKRFGKGAPALDHIDGEILGGRITGLVGPDGAGKTTLIRLMTGLMLPDEGKVDVLGFDTAKDPASIQASIGYMPQRFGLYEDLSVQENLDLYADLRSLPLAERAATYDELLEFTDLKRFTSRLAGKLSGGMKQKLGLACALLRKPRLLLLDEPGVGVDPISRRDLWKMVENLTASGIGVVWSTAYLDEAEACDGVLLLNEGKLLFAGAPSQLTGRIADRVFKVSGITGRRRETLARYLDKDGVVDGVIQGEAIRLVMAVGATPPSAPSENAGVTPQATVTPPRFEDAFIDMLGGGPGG